jgi:hypothetical protein
MSIEPYLESLWGTSPPLYGLEDRDRAGRSSSRPGPTWLCAPSAALPSRYGADGAT